MAWQYSYLVSGFPFSVNFGFSVLFDPNLYSDLEDPPPPVNTDWDVITLQPAPLLPDDGLYDALALVNGASLADPFTVRFVWLGGPGIVPGAQPFVVNEFDAQGHLLNSVPGQTAAVPEPGTLALIGLGLCGLALWKQQRKKGRV